MELMKPNAERRERPPREIRACVRDNNGMLRDPFTRRTSRLNKEHANGNTLILVAAVEMLRVRFSGISATRVSETHTRPLRLGKERT
jgi:3-phenylpropionate/cinnamic acid dioxygenase small subunit